MPDNQRLQSFREFWPFYLREHSNPMNRRLHYIGTTLGVFMVIASLIARSWLLATLAPVVAYGFAWTGHFVFEKNRPATFQYPLWSFMADFKMLGMFLTGKLKYPKN